MRGRAGRGSGARLIELTRLTNTGLSSRGERGWVSRRGWYVYGGMYAGAGIFIGWHDITGDVKIPNH